MNELSIGGRAIGTGCAPYVIAEISANHGGSRATAMELIEAARRAGADAVKFQHYSVETITTRSDHPDFQVTGGTIWDGAQLADLYAEAMTPWDWTQDLVECAERVGITWFSSPFDPSAVDFLEIFQPAAYKVASFELVDLPLIRYIASTGRPMILSTGMASIAEIDDAVQACAAADVPFALLRCNSGYPALPHEMDLRAITAMREAWQRPVGLSDHSLSNTAAITAVALGACIFEKHITLSRDAGGPDAAFSIEPQEFARYVDAIREAHDCLGTVRFGPSPREEPSRRFRRSLRAARDISAGETISHENVRSMRPAGGLPPQRIEEIVGAVALHDIAQGAPILTDDLAPAAHR